MIQEKEEKNRKGQERENDVDPNPLPQEEDAEHGLKVRKIY